MRKYFFALSLMLLLAGCARFSAAQRCQDEAGGLPDRWMYLFGVAGAIAAQQMPETKDYNRSMEACMARYDAAQKAAPPEPSDPPQKENDTRDQ
jgi:hypothetical protein